jgi:hypothetical protein
MARQLRGNAYGLAGVVLDSGPWEYLFVNDTGVVITAVGRATEDSVRWVVRSFSEPRDSVQEAGIGASVPPSRTPDTWVVCIRSHGHSIITRGPTPCHQSHATTALAKRILLGAVSMRSSETSES